MPKKIMVAGSLTSPSSKASNQAIAIARNAGSCLIAGKVGEDRKALEEVFIDEGVDISLLGNGAAFDTADIPESVAFLVIQNELTDEANLALARKAREIGAGVILNASPAQPVASALIEIVDVLVADRAGAATLAGQTVDSRESAAEAAKTLANAVEKIVVLLGNDGLVHMRRGGRIEYQPPFRAEPISSEGAEDFFVGALATQLAAGSEFEAAIHYAQAAYAAFVSSDVDKRHMIRPVQIRARLGEDEL